MKMAIHELRPTLNVQSDSIGTKVYIIISFLIFYLCFQLDFFVLIVSTFLVLFTSPHT